MAVQALEKVTLDVGDGTTMLAHVARPRDVGARHPGLLVFQEAFGVNEYIRDIAQRFAHEGFVAVAPELFHRTAAGFEGSYTDFEAIRPHTQALTRDGLIADIAAAFAWLAHEPQVVADQIAAVGFCLGGRVAYLANATQPLRAAISFYGGGIAPDLLPLAKDQHGPLLLFWGGRDKHIDPDQYNAVADALRSADKPYEHVVFSMADHGFFCERRASYHEGAARQAWVLLLEFLCVNDVLATKR
jgi:carboxymethylenebutenolidase